MKSLHRKKRGKTFISLESVVKKLPRILHAHPNLLCAVRCCKAKRVCTNQNLISGKKKSGVQVCTYFLSTALCSFQMKYLCLFSSGSFSFAKNFCWQYVIRSIPKKYSTKVCFRTIFK